MAPHSRSHILCPFLGLFTFYLTPPPPHPSALPRRRPPLPALRFHVQSLHFNFLSQIKPVYLLRTRAYSRTISKKPFLVNYQGAQFRVYPGDYQCLLDVGSRYKRVSDTASNVRPLLGGGWGEVGGERAKSEVQKGNEVYFHTYVRCLRWRGKKEGRLLGVPFLSTSFVSSFLLELATTLPC